LLPIVAVPIARQGFLTRVFSYIFILPSLAVSGRLHVLSGQTLADDRMSACGKKEFLNKFICRSHSTTEFHLETVWATKMCFFHPSCA
jgi:hypothetical protein